MSRDDLAPCQVLGEVGALRVLPDTFDAAAVRTKVESLLAKPPANMRKSLSDWAKRHGVALG